MARRVDRPYDRYAVVCRLWLEMYQEVSGGIRDGIRERNGKKWMATMGARTLQTSWILWRYKSIKIENVEYIFWWVTRCDNNILPRGRKEVVYVIA